MDGAGHGVNGGGGGGVANGSPMGTEREQFMAGELAGEPMGVEGEGGIPSSSSADECRRAWNPPSILLTWMGIPLVPAKYHSGGLLHFVWNE